MSGFMHSFTGEWDSLWFIGLFGLLVYFTMHSFTGEWDCVWFIGLFGLSVYLSMQSLIGQSLLVYRFFGFSVSA